MNITYRTFGAYFSQPLIDFVTLRGYSNCDSSTIRARFDYEGVRDAYDSSTIQHPTTSYEEPTRSYAHSSNIVRRKYHHFSDKVEMEYRLFLAIDMSLYRHKKIFFGGCAKFHSLLF